MSLPRVGLEERGTPMLDARTARILAEENEKGYEARWRREMVERCEKNIEKAVNEGRLHAVLFVGGLDDAKREALKVMRERGFEDWRGGLAGRPLQIPRRIYRAMVRAGHIPKRGHPSGCPSL